MRQSDAELLTIREWESWAAQNVKVPPASGDDALTFYGHLVSDRSDLLAFRHAGDKWQLIRSWLQRHEVMPLGLSLRAAIKPSNRKDSSAARQCGALGGTDWPYRRPGARRYGPPFNRQIVWRVT